MAIYQLGDYVEFTSGQAYDSSITMVQDGNLTMDFINSGSSANTITYWDTLTVEITDGSTSQKTYREVAIDGTSVNIGDFVTGDSLYFYVTGAAGTTVGTTTRQVAGQGWDTATHEGWENDSYDNLFFEGKYGPTQQYTQLKFRFIGSASGSSDSPSGQPLPGVAVSMFMGSVGLYLVKRKKAAKLS